MKALCHKWYRQKGGKALVPSGQAPQTGMKNEFFQNGTATVGSKPVQFSQRVVRDRFQMYVPVHFSEDKNLLSNYTYLFHIDKSPLSIAIKYTSATSAEDCAKQIGRYFNQDPHSLETLPCGVYYREVVTGSRFISVYSLRFAVEVPDGVLFGCFNCAADYKDDWRDVVLQMLQSVEVLEPAES